MKDSVKQNNRTDLLSQWTAVVGGKAPTGLSTVRLERGIRYEQQLDPALKRLDKQVNGRLKQLARQTRPARQKLMPGTRLLREWGNTTHEVAVTDQGYVYRGMTYRSLSAIAETITGTRWSGPKFFGLT